MKHKLLNILSISTIVATAVPIVALTSCGPDKNKDVDIKENQNIKITTNKIEVNKDFVITYNLDSNYGLNLAESKIVFDESNLTITLLECEIDRDNKTITVPGKYVKSAKVTVDIKAESNSAIQITDKDIADAADKLLTFNDSTRLQVSLNGISDTYDKSGEFKYSSEVEMEASLYGRRTHMYQCIGSGEKWNELNAYSEKGDNNFGIWSYEPSNDKLLKIPSVHSKAECWMYDEGTAFKNVPASWYKQDALFNVLYADYEYGSVKTKVFIKFTTSKYVSCMGLYVEQNDPSSPTIDVSYGLINYDYSYNQDIQIPSGSTLADKWIYNADDFTFNANQLECTLKAESEGSYKNCVGKYTIPMNKYTTVDTSKDLIINLDKSTETFDTELLVYNGSTLLGSTKYYFDPITFTLTIGQGNFNKTDNITLVFGYKLGGHCYCNAEKLIVHQ